MPTPTDPPVNGRRRYLGLAAVALWMTVFAAGVLIPSQSHRLALGWKPDNRSGGGEADLDSVASIKDSLASIKDRVTRLENARLSSSEASVPAQEPAISKPETGTAQKPPSKWWSFCVASLTFIPLNVAILSIIAAFLGGCTVSNQVKLEVQKEHDLMPPGPDKQLLGRRIHYLGEEPVFSAMRGLVVFLLLASGLFVFAGSDSLVSSENHRDALASYIKYAGLFSFIAYISGHDPTIFTSLLRFGSGPLNRQQPQTSASNAATEPPAPDAPTPAPPTKM